MAVFRPAVVTLADLVAIGRDQRLALREKGFLLAVLSSPTESLSIEDVVTASDRLDFAYGALRAIRRHGYGKSSSPKRAGDREMVDVHIRFPKPGTVTS